MPLSKVALMCLESSTYLKTDLLFARSGSTRPKRGKSKYQAIRTRSGSLFYAKYVLLRENQDVFFSYVNVSLQTFDYILENVRENLEAVVTPRKTGPEEKLFMTLRYLATGLTMKKLATAFHTVPHTAMKVVLSTLDAIWKKLCPIHLCEPTHAEMNHLAKEFFEKWKFPNCVGAIGGKYIRIQEPGTAVTRKVIVNAVVDANFRFLGVHIVKRNQATEETFKDVFKITGMQCLPQTEIMLPLVMIGNEAYPLKSNMMKPYPARAAAICKEKDIFNYRLKHARVPVDYAFEILTEKWKVYNRPFVMSIAQATMVVKVTCLLHNIIKDKEGDVDPHFSRFGQIDNGIIYLNLVSHKSRRNNRASSIAVSIRDQLREYICSYLRE